MHRTSSGNGDQPVAVGVDGGGTTTGVLVADREGQILASASGGGANPQHNPEPVAKSNVRGDDRARAGRRR